LICNIIFNPIIINNTVRAVIELKGTAKKKIKLSLSDEAEWEEYFNTESKKALELKILILTPEKFNKKYFES